MRSLFTGQPPPPEPSQVPKEWPTGFLMKRKLPPATHDEGPGAIMSSKEAEDSDLETRTEARTEKGDLALTLCHRPYLSSAQLALFGWTRETLEGNSASNLLFAQLIIWGSQKAGENNDFPSSCSWTGLVPFFHPRGQNPWKGSYLFWS